MKKVCNQCGSEDVTVDASASWNEETNDWEIDTIWQNAYCNDCDGKCHIDDVE